MIHGLRIAESETLMPRDRRTTLPLTALIAVMAYLASLTLMGAMVIAHAASSWTQGLGGTATVQIMPVSELDTDAQIAKALAILRAAPAVESAETLSVKETQALLEPWLGANEAIGELPLPRLIALRLASGSTDEMDLLAARLETEVPGATLDTHLAWRERLANFSGTLGFAAYGILILIAGAAAAAVVFATRAGLEMHHDIVEVLHLVGAHDSFIANEFQQRFLRLGLEAGLIGTALGAVSALLVGFFTGDADAAYLPSLAPSLEGYLTLLLVPLAAALVAMFTARFTVMSALRRMI